jgi:CDP-diacylglycerol--glycerol-3-phosphate 3-phosphatidyltransferase
MPHLQIWLLACPRATSALLHPPNLISLTRVPLAVAFVLLPGTTVRIGLVVAAAASDWLDGWWARTRGPASSTGAILDPATDKIFVVSALLGFVTSGVLSLPQLALLLARDIFVALGALVVLTLRLPVRLRARFPGKLLTNVQIAAVLILLLAPAAAPVLVAVTAILSFWAVLDYASEGVRSLRRPIGSG